MPNGITALWGGWLKRQKKNKAMAIYHCSAHNVSRSSGRTATASIAYRAGEKIHDQRTGLTHDYTKRARYQEIAHTQIISNLGIKIDRSELWNLAEQRENRKDARTAKEFVIALPHELDKDQRQALAVEFAQHLVNRYGCIADIAIHTPSRAGDERNHHAHIMLTTRKAELDDQNSLVLTDKITLELKNAKRLEMGLQSSSKEIISIRQDWERIANAHLERAGIDERIDHRSHKELENGKIPQIHETPQVTAMRRKGIETEISRANDERRAYNAQIDHQNALERPTEPQKAQESDLLAKAQASLQNRLQERLNEREQARQAEQQAKEQAQQKENQHNKQDWGFSR